MMIKLLKILNTIKRTIFKKNPFRMSSDGYALYDDFWQPKAQHAYFTCWAVTARIIFIT